VADREVYQNVAPGRIEPTQAEAPDQVMDGRQRRWDRTRMVRIVCTIVNVVCGLFAVVLFAHIVMVMGEANPANGVASFVRGFSAAVSLGFNDLFTPSNVKVQVLLNEGFAAIAWLALGAVVTTLIRRFALPSRRDFVH
jgi:hypothetical protein